MNLISPANRSQFDVTGQAFKRDPFPTFAALLDAGPLVALKVPIIGKVHFTTSHEATTRLLKDVDSFALNAKNAGRKIAGLQWWMPSTLRVLAANMLTSDDPDHKRLRGLVDQAFHRRGVETLRPRIAEITDGLLDQIAKNGKADLVAEYCRPLPLAVISELLGLPEEDRLMFMSWGHRITSSATSTWGFLRAMPLLGKLNTYFKQQFVSCRASPRPGLISELVAVEQSGHRLSEDELLAMTWLLLFAGHETTVHLLSGAVRELLRNQDQKDLLTSDWNHIATTVEEMLRFVAPVQMTKPRYLRQDTEFYGRKFKRGEIVMGFLACANADPAVFDKPDTLDIMRNPNPHLSFGSGMHFCLGLQLARAEAQIAVQRLFERFPNLALAVPGDDLDWSMRLGLRALNALPVRLA